MHDFDPRLYLVTDRSMLQGYSLAGLVKEAAEQGVTAVQLREKQASFREFLHLAGELKNVLDPLQIPLLINDRVDVALAVDAAGVHLGTNDMPPDIARRLLGFDKIIGLSVETEADIAFANQQAIDYIGVSPVFKTPTKTDTITEWGLEGVRYVAEHSRHKVVGIGGLNRDNVAEVMQHDADGVAVVSAICTATYPGKAAMNLRQLIDEASRWR